ncbi:MAG TPA: DUF2924 domain-containing protein [Gemmataceae bacterium]|nr:DUF2924 domain-containing protein [Gemmataceae bacterium]
MHPNLVQELAALTRMTVGQLRLKFAALFGEETRSGNKAWLVKRVAWRLQARAEGDLSERARQRAEELARDADLRLTPPRTAKHASPGTREKTHSLRLRADTRIPPPGTILKRFYKGKTLQVQVLEHGFACAGEVYPTLSAVAKAVTGSHCNGYLFFRLPSKEVES